MYETRQQTSLQQDENKREEIKAVKGLVAGLGKAQGQTAPVNNRRALGDIGNLVGAAACANASKEGQIEFQNLEKRVPLAVIDRPVTREESKAVEEAATGIDQISLSETKPESTLNSKVSNSTDFPPRHPASMKQLMNGRGKHAVATGKERKGRTLTATLAARSEAACGGFKLEVDVDPVANIDAGDIGNQFAVVDYIEDIYSFYRKAETQYCVPPSYVSNQPHINEKMRAILVDWLIEVHYKFKLMPETLFLTINLIDRYLSIKSVERKNLQLVGLTAMLVASKYEEIWAPEIQDLIVISDNAYTRQQILDMEKVMLNTLRFNLCIPTPYMFLVRFLKAAASDRQMDMLAFYFVELCLVDYTMLRFSPSMLAASAVFLARNTLKSGQDARWNATLRWHSTYEEAQLIECASLIIDLRKKAGEGNATVVHRKYTQAKYNAVALLNPPSIVVAPSGAVDPAGEHHHK